jgi:hypothetical protein
MYYFNVYLSLNVFLHSIIRLLGGIISEKEKKKQGLPTPNVNWK